MQPAAFDRRVYEGSQVHSLDLIARDAQDHNGQFQKVSDADFVSNGGRASVFSSSRSALHAHAGFGGMTLLTECKLVEGTVLD